MVSTNLFLLFFNTFRRWSVLDTYRSASGEKLCDLKNMTFVDGSGQVRNLKWSRKWCLTNSVIDSITFSEGLLAVFLVTWMECSEWSGPCSTIQFRMLINMTTSFARQDQTHGANSIVHFLKMMNLPSTLLCCQRIWGSLQKASVYRAVQAGAFEKVCVWCYSESEWVFQ